MLKRSGITTWPLYMESKGKRTYKPKMTVRKQLFADNYLIHHNATQAAIDAGYAEVSAAVTGVRLLKDTAVIEYIHAKTEKLFDKLEITQEKVMKEYARLAFYDARKFWGDDGQLKKVVDLDDDTAAALQGMEIEEKKGGRGGKKSTRTAKIKLADKKGALDSICRIKGWNNPEGEEGMVINVTIRKGGKDAGNKH